MQQETIKKIGDRRLVENMIAQVAATKEGAENGKIFWFKVKSKHKLKEFLENIKN